MDRSTMRASSSSSSAQPPIQPWKVADARANKDGQCQMVYWVKPTPPSASALRSLPASTASSLPPPSIRHYTATTTYKGEWRHNQRHGYGTLTTSSWIYEGSFQANKQHGQGQLFIRQPDGTTHRAYSGDWVAGKRDGVGVYFYVDGSRYEGQWAAGLRHGNGTLFFPSGDTYTGGWDRGQQSGFGSLVRVCGDVYEGMYVRGRREGQGMYYYRDKDKMFDGEWVSDQPVTGVILAARDFFAQQRQQQQAEEAAGDGQSSSRGSRPASEGGRFSLSRPTTAAMLEVSRMVMEDNDEQQIPPLELTAPDTILAQQLTSTANQRAPIRALTALPPLTALYPPAALTLLRTLFDNQLAQTAKQQLHPPHTQLIHTTNLKPLIENKWRHEGRRVGRTSSVSDEQLASALSQLSRTVECERDGLVEVESADTIGWSSAVYVVWLVEQQRRTDEMAGREERERQAQEMASRLSGRREVATAKVEEEKEQLVVSTDVNTAEIETEQAESNVEDTPAVETSQAALFDATNIKTEVSQ